MPSRGFTNILAGHLPFYSGKDGYNKILPSMPYWEPSAVSSELYGQKYPLLFWVPPHFLEFAPPNSNPNPLIPTATTVGSANQNSCQREEMFTSGFSIFPCQGSQATSPIRDTWATAPASGPSRSWYDDPWRLMPIGQLVNEYKKLSVVRKAHGLDPSLLDSLIAPSHHSPPRW